RDPARARSDLEPEEARAGAADEVGQAFSQKSRTRARAVRGAAVVTRVPPGSHHGRRCGICSTSPAGELEAVVPKTMKAVQVSRAGGPFELVEREIPEVAPGQVRI